MSSLYYEAADVIQAFWNRTASLKTLVYDSPSPKKSYLFALCNKTLLAQHLLDDIVINTQELAGAQVSNKALLYVMLYDSTFGQGVRGGGSIVRLLRSSKKSIDRYLNHLMKEANVKSVGDLLPKEETTEQWKYLRVNRAKTSVAAVKQELSTLISEDQIKEDDMISCILRIPSSVDLHSHPLVTSLSIILQTKASCFPPFLLLRDIESNPDSPLHFDVIDATAAPGNKTTFLGDILRGHGTVFAFDRDEKRYQLLKSRCDSYGSGNVPTPSIAHHEITCIHHDFLTTNPYASTYANVQRIQLDPSCSGSGMSHTSLDFTPPSKQRIHHLRDFQLRCILHAAEFPAVTHISYPEMFSDALLTTITRRAACMRKKTKKWFATRWRN
ncbi:hypothetical protein WA577_004235 [Blastocystis sp. JDR]